MTSTHDRACAAPRPWLLAAPVPHGPWRLLVYLWTYGPYWRPEDPLPAHGEVHAWPTKARCSSDLGVPRNTVDDWVKRLSRDGWIRRDGNAWALAVGAPNPSWVTEGGGVAPGVEAHPGCEDTPRGVEDHPSPGCEDTPPGVESHPPYDHPLILHGSSREPPPEKPAPLVLVSPEHIVTVDPVGELRELHERLRRDALAAWGRRRTELPKPGTPAAKKLDQRIRAALRAYGQERCREYIEWRGREWMRDEDSLKYSRGQAWSTAGLEYGFGAIDGGGSSPRRAGAIYAAPNPRAEEVPDLPPDFFGEFEDYG